MFFLLNQENAEKYSFESFKFFFYIDWHENGNELTSFDNKVPIKSKDPKAKELKSNHMEEGYCESLIMLIRLNELSWIHLFKFNESDNSANQLLYTEIPNNDVFMSHRNFVP